MIIRSRCCAGPSSRIAEKLENGYRAVWWRYWVTAVIVSPYTIYTSITRTRRPDDRTTGSSKMTYRYQPKPRFSGFSMYTVIFLWSSVGLCFVQLSYIIIIIYCNAICRHLTTNSIHIYKESHGYKKISRGEKNWKIKRTSIIVVGT